MKERRLDGEIVLWLVWGTLLIGGLTLAMFHAAAPGWILPLLWGSSLIGVPSSLWFAWCRRAAALADAPRVARRGDGLHLGRNDVGQPVLGMAFYFCWFGTIILVIAWGTEPPGDVVAAEAIASLALALAVETRRRKRLRSGADAIICGRDQVVLPMGPGGSRATYPVASVAGLRIQILESPRVPWPVAFDHPRP